MDRRADHDQLHAVLLTGLLDVADGDDGLAEMRQLRVFLIEHVILRLQVLLQFPDGGGVPFLLVVAAGLGHVNVLHRHQVTPFPLASDLVDPVGRVGEQVPGVELQFGGTVHLAVHVPLDLVLLVIIADRVLGVHQQHQVLHVVMLGDVFRQQFLVLQVAAVPGHVIETGIHILVQVFHRDRRSLRTPEDIGVVLSVMPVQVTDFRHPGIHGHIVVIPLHDRVAEHPEGVRADVEAHQRADHHYEYREKDCQILFKTHRPPLKVEIQKCRDFRHIHYAHRQQRARRRRMPEFKHTDMGDPVGIRQEKADRSRKRQ